MLRNSFIPNSYLSYSMQFDFVFSDETIDQFDISDKNSSITLSDIHRNGSFFRFSTNVPYMSHLALICSSEAMYLIRLFDDEALIRIDPSDSVWDILDNLEDVFDCSPDFGFPLILSIGRLLPSPFERLDPYGLR